MLSEEFKEFQQKCKHRIWMNSVNYKCRKTRKGCPRIREGNCPLRDPIVDDKKCIAMLRKKAKSNNYMDQLWTMPKSRQPKRRYRLTRRVGDCVYVLWNAFGDSYPMDLSRKVLIEDFIKEYKIVEIRIC